MIYSFEHFKLDTARFELWRNGDVVALEPQVLELLILLITHRDRIVTKDELLETIWQGRSVSDATLSSRIKAARQAIDDDGSAQRVIRTIHGRGFRFIVDVGTAQQTQDNSDNSTSLPCHPVTRYAKSGDVHIAYQSFGDGPINLVFAPGFVSHIENYWDEPGFNHLLSRLGTMARVALFDKRGTGLSDPVGTLPGMDDRMDDVRAVMDAVGFEQAVIMGISEGGSLAAVFAAHHPTRCLGAILYGAFARFTHWFPTPESLQDLFDYIETSWGTGANLANFAPSMAGNEAFQQWWGKFERLGATPGNAIALMRMNNEINITSILPSIQVPTLVIHRAEDVLVDVAGGRELAAGIPEARYVELPGSDHLPWTGDIDALLNTIADFISDLPATEPERTLATVLVADLKASQDAEKTFSGAMDRFRGEPAGGQGDKLLATFDGPARAMRCARYLVATVPQARIGLHAGEVDLIPGTVQGLAVDLATGVAEHANPGEVLVSRTVKDLVAGSGIAFAEAGAYPLASITQPWRLFRVASSKQTT